ncbi:MAG: aspartyl/asparaginyl beta-hydroxylase domain-containing protein [Blastocatellia bacterium]
MQTEMKLTATEQANVAALLSELKDKYGSSSMERIEEGFAMALGLKPPYTPPNPYQGASDFIVPGLSAKPWRDNEEFPIIPQLEASWEIIRTELRNALEKKMGFQQYLDPARPFDPTSPVPKEWKSLYLKEEPEDFSEHRKMCPETTKLISHPSVSNVAMFSALNPKGHIKPHFAGWNYELNLHLGLIIPEDCGIRCGPETRKWQEGKCFVFDGSHEHEAWNNSDTTRFILLLSIWHVDLTEGEIEFLRRARNLVDLEVAERHFEEMKVEQAQLANQKWWV